MKLIYISILLCFASHFANGQSRDSVSMTLDEAEAQFVKNNLQLLAQQYNITMANANVIQAKIWDLPVASGEINMINPHYRNYTGTDHYFNLGSGAAGEKALGISQLIKLGGKRKSQIEFAKSNVDLAQIQFEQLLRDLKLQLDQNFYSYYFDAKKIQNIDLQLEKLEAILNDQQLQVDKGYVSLKDVVRMQSLVLAMRSSRTDLVKALISSQHQMSLITGLDVDIYPIVIENQILDNYKLLKLNKDGLYQVALENNLDYKFLLKTMESQDLFLKWQKTLAKADIIVGLAYDQAGGAFLNQTDLQLTMPLTFWNVNKGNIKMAAAQKDQSVLNKDYEKTLIKNSIDASIKTWQMQKNQLDKINANVTQNLQTVFDGIIENFKGRNLTLLDFTDFMDSYNQTNVNLMELKKQVVLEGLNLNYITSTNAFVVTK